MNINILIIISCICLLFIIGKIFIIPLKKIIKLVFNSILGGLLIYLINLIGGIWGFHIGLNLFTAILVRNIRCSRGRVFDSSKNSIRWWIITKLQYDYIKKKNPRANSSWGRRLASYFSYRFD